MTTVEASVGSPRHLPARLHEDWWRLTAPTVPAEADAVASWWAPAPVESADPCEGFTALPGWNRVRA